MKALHEYFLMVVFTLLLNRVRVFANVMFNLNRETWQWKFKGRETRRESEKILYHRGYWWAEYWMDSINHPSVLFPTGPLKQASVVFPVTKSMTARWSGAKTDLTSWPTCFAGGRTPPKSLQVNCDVPPHPIPYRTCWIWIAVNSPRSVL